MTTNTTSTTTSANTKCLTAEEVAARFRVTAQSVRAWARAGRIPAYRLGTQFRFDIHEIEAKLAVKVDGDER